MNRELIVKSTSASATILLFPHHTGHTMMDKTDSRYPYTYACDHIRSIVGPQCSRAQASQVRKLLADLAGIDDEEMARRIADKAIEEFKASKP